MIAIISLFFLNGAVAQTLFQMVQNKAFSERTAIQCLFGFFALEVFLYFFLKSATEQEINFFYCILPSLSLLGVGFLISMNV